VRVDVVDLGRIDPRVGKCHRHRPGRILALGIGLGDVQRVGGQAVTRKLRVDLGAARACVLQLLEHENGAALAHHETVAVAIEGTTAGLRVIVPPRECAHGREAADPNRSDPRLRAAGEHYVGATEPDRVGGIAERDVRGGAGRALGQ